MAKLKVSLGIGYPTAVKADIIDVDDFDLENCETEEEKEDLLLGYWQEWANNYIDITYELI